MRNPDDVFHLAIPCRDIEEALQFYVDGLGCQAARRYPDRVTINFFGDQLVCHLAPAKVEQDPQMYPRHFGITFRERADFDDLLKRAEERELPFFEGLFVRFEGRPEEHLAFFLKDPSNNLIEFKYYRNPRMMY